MKIRKDKRAKTSALNGVKGAKFGKLGGRPAKPDPNVTAHSIVMESARRSAAPPIAAPRLKAL